RTRSVLQLAASSTTSSSACVSGFRSASPSVPGWATRRSRAVTVVESARPAARPAGVNRPTPDEREVSVAASREEIFERVKSVLSEQLGVDEGEITEEASFQDDLDADSLDLVELIMELEDNFGMKIPDEDAQKITTVGQAVDYVAAHQ